MPPGDRAEIKNVKSAKGDIEIDIEIYRNINQLRMSDIVRRQKC